MHDDRGDQAFPAKIDEGKDQAHQAYDGDTGFTFVSMTKGEDDRRKYHCRKLHPAAGLRVVRSARIIDVLV